MQRHRHPKIRADVNDLLLIFLVIFWKNALCDAALQYQSKLRHTLVRARQALPLR
jgi:hypothetical protein